MANLPPRNGGYEPLPVRGSMRGAADEPVGPSISRGTSLGAMPVPGASPLASARGAPSSRTQSRALSSSPRTQAAPISPQTQSRQFLNQGVIEEVVQFASSIFFCTEDHLHATVDVMRIGLANQHVSCDYCSKDVSATAGAKYKGVSGRLDFEPGEVMKSIDIPILNDDFWDSTLEFQMHLVKPIGCKLGNTRARVLILDDDIFPTNAYRKEIMSQDEEVVASISVRLLFCYLRFVFFRVPSIWWKSAITACLDQLSNVYYIMTIMMKVYLVDVVFHVSPETEDRLLIPGNRYMSAMALAILWVVPNFILLGVGRLKVGPLDMSKAIRQHFQVNLFRKYLNYTEISKRQVPVQDLTTAMDADIPMLVDDGYMFMFDLFQGCGKILIVAFYMIFKDPKCMLPLVLFPTVMLLFLRSRQEKDVELEGALIRAEAGATGMLVNAVEGFQLIRDFGQRHAMAHRYAGSLEKAKDANDNMICFKFWNAQLVPWLTLLGVGVYLAVGSQAVLLGQMSIGSFLAMVEIYKELGDRFQGIYDSLAAGMQAGSPLCELTKMLNLPTDMKDRMGRSLMRRKFMYEKVEELRDTTPKDTKLENLFDRLPLVIDGLRIKYIKALQNVHAEVQPGTLVFLTGAHGTGKATMVRILTDIFIPVQGQTLYACHNRCLHVSHISEVMPYLTLYQNLTFSSTDDNPELVRKIIVRLGLGDHWILRELDKQIEDNDPGFNNTRLRHGDTSTWNKELDAALPKDESWTIRLSHNERKMINLARALLFNPEILVLQKPLDDCDTDDVEIILSVLREFVDNRGIAEDVPFRARRPRTVFFSGGINAHSTFPIEMADVVWHLEHEHGVVIEFGGKGKHYHLTHPAGAPPPRASPRTSASKTPEMTIVHSAGSLHKTEASDLHSHEALRAAEHYLTPGKPHMDLSLATLGLPSSGANPSMGIISSARSMRDSSYHEDKMRPDNKNHDSTWCTRTCA